MPPLTLIERHHDPDVGHCHWCVRNKVNKGNIQGVSYFLRKFQHPDESDDSVILIRS
jgi:hypothetical protein